MIGRLLFRHPLPPLLLIWLCIALLEFGGVWDRLNSSLLDFSLRRIARVEDAPSDAALVLIDERTIQSVGNDFGFRWPWRRDAFAWLAAGLHQAGARQIVFDMAFVETTDALYDDMLGSVTAACPGLVLGALPAQGEIAERRPAIWPAEWIRNQPELARRIGYVQPVVDRDGVLRRYAFADSLVARAVPDGKTAPSTSEVLRWYGGARELAARGSALSALDFILAGRKVLDGVPDEVLLDPKKLAGKWGELPRFDFNGVLRGKTVFVGANTAATYDRVATPVGRLEPGVLVHYTAWANAVRGECIHEMPRLLGKAPEILLAAALAAALLLFGWRRKQLGLTWIIGIAGGLSLLGGTFVLLRFGWWFPPAASASAGGLAMGLLMSASHNWWAESQRKQEIQSLFGNYVSDRVVRELLENPNAIRFGGERKRVSIYFSDLAGFTAFSERVQPEVLVEIMNRYLAEMSEILIEERGYLDKFIGDAIMGVFGAPEVLPNHALSACRTALRSQQRLAEISPGIEAEYGVKLSARIGINTGEVVVGNFGSERKRNYTVVGDTANFASRLEAANKEFGSEILIGPETAEMVKGELLTRPVARLRVPGKSRPQETFELLGEAGAGRGERDEFLRAYLAGYEAFFRRDFPVAEQNFRIACAVKPVDKVAAYYLQQAAKWVLSAPPADWEGLYVVNSK